MRIAPYRSRYSDPVVGGPLPLAIRDASTAQTSGVVSTVNLVAVFSYDSPISIPKFVREWAFAAYNPKNFASIRIHLASPNTTASISGSGRVVLTEARDAMSAYLAATRFGKFVSKTTKRPVRVVGMRIVNITATIKIGRCIDVRNLVDEMGVNGKYNAAAFPCCFINAPANPTVMHIVSINGNINVTGARTVRHFVRSLRVMYEAYAQNSYRARDEPVATRHRKSRRAAAIVVRREDDEEDEGDEMLRRILDFDDSAWADTESQSSLES